MKFQPNFQRNLNRRQFLKKTLLAGAAISVYPRVLFALPYHRIPLPRLCGVNTYFLLVEAYRKALRNPGGKLSKLIHCYLRDDVQLSRIREESSVNALRFWAFNDYPAPSAPFPPYVFEGRLWLNATKPDKAAQEVLQCLVEQLTAMGWVLVPVLSNFWPSYGGILQYLVWAGHLKEEDYIQALCSPIAEGRIYLKNCVKFYASPAVESLFRAHLSRILPYLIRSKQVRILEIMNEPRGKNPYCARGKLLKDGRDTCDVVARWLNRQARWIRNFIQKENRAVPYLSSGEEGWIESPLKTKTTYLKGDGQFYEGIDLVKNTRNSLKGITIGSIHMYPHPVIRRIGTNICGARFPERRGWGFLLKKGIAPTFENYRGLAREWIVTRARYLKGTPWYLGEMGWCWPETSAGTGIADAKTLFQQRKILYREWLELTFERGGVGGFVWMLNGRQHRDPFYGLSASDIISLMPKG